VDRLDFDGQEKKNERKKIALSESVMAISFLHPKNAHRK